jgi:hypothetical protein
VTSPFPVSIPLGSIRLSAHVVFESLGYLIGFRVCLGAGLIIGACLVVLINGATCAGLFFTKTDGF